MAFFRRILPTSIAISVSLFVLAALLTPYPVLDNIGTYFVDLAIIIAAFALFLGVTNIIRVHAGKIRDGESGRFYSFVLLAAMLVVLTLGLPPLPNKASGPMQPTVQWIFANMQAPIQSSLSALLAFFVALAAYRLLRVRSLESALMLAAALFVLAGQVTLGLVPVLPEISDWILNVPAMAGVRGILLGVALGTLLTGIRLLLGVERPYSD